MSAQTFWSQLVSKGIQAYKSNKPKDCQLCWKHKSRFRRKCPICERLIAPGCWPVRCWCDELNHCRNCHTVIGALKQIRYNAQYVPHNSEPDTQKICPKTTSYKDFPIGIQINIMLFLFQTKDFIWSGLYIVKNPRIQKCGCPTCTYFEYSWVVKEPVW